MNVNVHAISTSVYHAMCIFKDDIEVATSQDSDLQRLKSHMI